MNVKQAKSLDLPALLAKLGHHPVLTRKGGKELWYRSPFRKEKEPSFSVSRGHSWPYVWKDFGDIGGTVIDFVMRYKGFNSVSDALAFLSSHYSINVPPARFIAKGQTSDENQTSLFSFDQQTAKPSKFFDPQAAELQLIDANPIQNPIIRDYLMQIRKIPDNLIQKYLLEIRYKHLKTGKDYFAFGMTNQSGGYEIRAASDSFSFKSVLGGRDISFFKGTTADGQSVNVFEGMIDYLSLLAMYKVEQGRGDVIVMHSLSSFSRACSFINQEGYEEVKIFLDNDKAGERHTELFQQEFGEKVKPQNEFYQGYKDLNVALVQNQPQLKP